MRLEFTLANWKLKIHLSRIYENKDELKNEINKSLLNEVYTNKATTEYRETKLANLRVIIRKPYCEIDTENVATLQFLDLIKEVVDISEVDGEELTNRLIDYMKKKNIKFENLKPFLPYYPERIYKNMIIRDSADIF